MPEGKVSIAKKLPDTILLDVLVLIDAALPPLDVAAWMRLIDTVVGAGAHDGAHAHPGVAGVGVDIDNVLHHGVVQQEAVHGAVAALDKGGLEAALVEAADACFPAVARAQELDVGVWVVGKQVDDFIVEAFVQVVAVLVVCLADFGLVWVECQLIDERSGMRVLGDGTG